jgi:hypothetical protein
MSNTNITGCDGFCFSRKCSLDCSSFGLPKRLKKSARHKSTTSIAVEPFYFNKFDNGYDTLTYYPYDSISIQLSIDSSIFLTQDIPKIPSFPFTQAAYACDCDWAKIITTNHISSVQIRSKVDTNYNDTFQLKKGASINDLFVVSDIFIGTPSYALADFFSRFGRPNEEQSRLHFLLKQKPSHPVILVFDIEVKFNDGKTFLFANQQLKVK